MWCLRVKGPSVGKQSEIRRGCRVGGRFSGNVFDGVGCVDFFWGYSLLADIEEIPLSEFLVI